MGFFSSVKSAVKSAGSSIKKAVSSASSSVKSAVSSAVSSVKKKAESFKKDVLNENVLVSTIGGAVAGFASGGIPGAIAGAVGGVATGREATLAQRRAEKEAEEYADSYEIAENGALVGSGFVDGRTTADVINDTLGQIKDVAQNQLTKRQRYQIFTNALDKSGARG